MTFSWKEIDIDLCVASVLVMEAMGDVPSEHRDWYGEAPRARELDGQNGLLDRKSPPVAHWPVLSGTHMILHSSLLFILFSTI